MGQRQRKWYGKRKGTGKCFSCAAPAVTKYYCEYHQKLRNEAQNSPERKEKRKRYYREAFAKKLYGPLWENQVLVLKINDEIRRITNA